MHKQSLSFFGGGLGHKKIPQPLTSFCVEGDSGGEDITPGALATDGVVDE